MALFVPTGARMLMFYDVSSALRGRLVSPQPLYWPIQRPSETVLLGADFGLISGGATVVTLSIGSSDTALVLSEASVVGTAIVFTAHGGTPDGLSVVGIKATYADGEVRYREAVLPIGPAITISLGQVTPNVDFTSTDFSEDFS